MAARRNYCLFPSCELDSNSDGFADGLTGGVLSGTQGGAWVYTLPIGRTRGLAQRIQYTGVAGDTGAHVFYYPKSDVGTFANGDPCTFSFHAKGALSGVTLTARILFRNAAGGGLTLLDSSAFSLLSGWSRFYFTFVATNASTSMVWCQYHLNDINSGDTIDLTIDDALIDKSSALGSYFDGNQGGVWEGAANASTSLQMCNSVWLPGGLGRELVA